MIDQTAHLRYLPWGHRLLLEVHAQTTMAFDTNTVSKLGPKQTSMAGHLHDPDIFAPNEKQQKNFTCWVSEINDGRKQFLVTYNLFAFYVFLQLNVSSSKMNTGPHHSPLGWEPGGLRGAPPAAMRIYGSFSRVVSGVPFWLCQTKNRG